MKELDITKLYSAADELCLKMAKEYCKSCEFLKNVKKKEDKAALELFCQSFLFDQVHKFFMMFTNTAPMLLDDELNNLYNHSVELGLNSKKTKYMS